VVLPVRAEAPRAGLATQVINLVQSLITMVLWLPRKIIGAIRFMASHMIGFILAIVGGCSSKTWGFFVSFCNFVAKVLGPIPIIGKFLAWLFGLPSRMQLPGWVQQLAAYRQAFQAVN
jgi:hypothetical protein